MLRAEQNQSIVNAAGPTQGLHTNLMERGTNNVCQQITVLQIHNNFHGEKTSVELYTAMYQ